MNLEQNQRLFKRLPHSPVRLVGADEVDLILTGIRAILAGWMEGQVVGLFTHLPDLLNALAPTTPDVILLGERLDLDLPTLSIIETLKTRVPHARLVLLGMSVDGVTVKESFDRGIHAYLCKTDPLHELLIPALEAVKAGRPYLSPAASAAYLLATQQESSTRCLTAEAMGVLRLLAEGFTVNQIASRLRMKVRRVYSVRGKLRRRFGAMTNEVIVSRARVEGILP